MEGVGPISDPKPIVEPDEYHWDRGRVWVKLDDLEKGGHWGSGVFDYGKHKLKRLDDAEVGIKDPSSDLCVVCHVGIIRHIQNIGLCVITRVLGLSSKHCSTARCRIGALCGKITALSSMRKRRSDGVA
jgi:hypothetical protein